MGILGSLFGKKKMTAAETAFVKRQSQIFADCIRIIADTTDIETYFYRYGLAEQTVAQVAILSVWLAEGFPRTNAPKCYKTKRLPIQTIFFLGTFKKKPCIFSAYLAGR